MVKHPNESRFEFALRLTKALKDNEDIVLSGEYSRPYLDSKTMLDLIYEEIRNPIDPLKGMTAPPMEAPEMTWSLATDMVNVAVKQAYANRDRTVNTVDSEYDMEDEFNAFSPSLLNEPHSEPYKDPALLVDDSFVDTLREKIEASASQTLLHQRNEVVCLPKYQPTKLIDTTDTLREKIEVISGRWA
jgi:hypothetical protein